jgi:hypothetical protein
MITESALLMTDSEAGVRGELVTVVAGRLTKCTALITPYAILAKDTVAGTNVATDYLKIRHDCKYKCDIGGVGSPTAGLMVGTISTDGLSLNAAVLTGGKVEVVSVDLIGRKAIVIF